MAKSSGYSRFKRAVLRWADKLGLDDWCFQIQQGKLSKNTLANVGLDWVQRNALVTWSTRDHSEAKLTPEQVALHETLHVLFYPMLCCAAESKDPGSSTTQSEEHAVIRKLIKLLEEK